MSEVPSSEPVPAVAPAEIDASCRLPLLVIFLCAACWLVIGSAFALISSIKFHSPNFLADSAWLTYGRVRPAYLNCLLYGFCLQAGLGVALWLLARLGRTPLAQPGLVIVGSLLWNFGLKLGIWGILSGDGTGFEYLDMPGYAAWIILLAYLLIGLSGVLTFHQRRERQLFVSQWFIFAALFWFPWIYSTAELLLVTFPVRGAAQVAILGYYVANLGVIWLALIGLAAIFYFIPKLTHHELHSRYLALFTFWVLILFGGWVGIPNSAPLPAWMPALSTVATMLMAVPLATIALTVHRTLDGKWSKLTTNPPLQFIAVGTIAFILAGLMKIAITGIDVTYPISFTWLTPAQAQLNSYGFFSLVMFGAIYSILPQLTQTEFPSPKLVCAHFWLALLGLLLSVVPLALGGIVEAHRLHNPSIAFMEVMKSTLPFLRVSTMGDLLIALGHLIFLVNLAGLAIRFYRPRAVSAYAAATADLTAAEAKP
jgi:cytochrome c oxidase cbb3-type subunit 1